MNTIRGLDQLGDEVIINLDNVLAFAPFAEGDATGIDMVGGGQVILGISWAEFTAWFAAQPSGNGSSWIINDFTAQEVASGLTDQET